MSIQEDIKKAHVCAVWEHQIKEGESLADLKKGLVYHEIIDIYDKCIADFWSLDKALDYKNYLDTIAEDNIFYYVQT